MNAPREEARSPWNLERLAPILYGVVSEQLGVERDRIRPETRLEEDLRADSLDIVELIMEVEDEFGIDIPDDEAEKIETIDQLTQVTLKIVNNPDDYPRPRR